MTWLSVVIGASVLGLVVAAALAREVLSADAGTGAMQEVAAAIREGAHAFLLRQYRTVALLAGFVAVVLYVVYADLGAIRAARLTGAFALGAASSAGAGYWGMVVSIRANVRVAAAARTSLGGASKLALRAGGAAALAVLGSALGGLSVLFAAFGGLAAPREVAHELVGFAFGASFVALFAQLGGGIYTKAADVGADLVGKLESRIPEDDPRNPAVIADLVGDDVGDCAGRGADLFESAAAETIGAMILGVALIGRFGIGGVLLPLVASAFGLAASVAGVLTVRAAREDEDPMRGMTRGHLVTAALSAVGLFAATRLLLGDQGWLFAASLVGLAAGVILSWLARYYTSTRRRPVRAVAASSTTGAATNVLEGLSVALECTFVPVLVISAALLASYGCGARALPGVAGAGVYGTAVATIGMLAPAAYVLSMDVFGPITDNAGGIVEMSGEGSRVRERTDRLDAAGNSTKAVTKGYAIGSAALAAFLLFSAYLESVSTHASRALEHVDIGRVPVFVGGLVGASAVFLFSALAIRAVSRDANAVVEEVRRQMRETPAIMESGAKPDYGRCVDIVTAGALHGMIAPGLLAVAAPIAVGVVFRGLATREDPTLGAEAVGGALMVGTIAGVLLALAMNTGGGAWDNAKKLIERGELGGKGSPAHAAAVVGDAVGDPLKDTAGPSLHVLVKLLGTVSLVSVPLFV